LFSYFATVEVNLDAMDVSGEQHIELEQTIHKHRLSAEGEWLENKVLTKIGTKEPKAVAAPLPDNYCGPCYGANTAEGEVRLI
jgi:hypothetical protein